MEVIEVVCEFRPILSKSVCVDVLERNSGEKIKHLNTRKQMLNY